jgi:hypothetical protein
MMKIFIIAMMLLLSLNAVNKREVVTNSQAIGKGLTKETKCTYGYLTVHVSDKNKTFAISYPVCTTFSAWDSECTHKPIPCKKEK